MDDKKYRVLLETLKTDILNGKYGSEHPLPSVRALVRKFNISSATVLHAFEELSKLGLVCRRQGAGTFVTKQGGNRKIGLILPGVAYSEFFPPIVSELSRLAIAHGYTLVLGDAALVDHKARASQVKDFAEEFVRDHVAGVIFQPLELVSGAEKKNRVILDLFKDAGIPVVLTCCDYVQFPDRSEFDVVGIDNVAAGAILARHLMSLGVRKIDFLLCPTRGASSRDRYRGMENAVRFLAKSGCRCRMFKAKPEDVKALRGLLKHGKPDAFVCGTDGDAAIFRGTLEKVGLSVPKDVLLAGFNDVQMAALLTPPLTTIRIPREEIAKVAFKRLLDRISDPSLLPITSLLPVELVIRESTNRKGARRMKR